jgi:sulfopyruvate decarboxylase TPP-binding subunit
MADEQVIITRFTSDLSSFEAGVKEYTDLMNQAEGAAKKLDSTEQKLNTTTGSLADKFDAAAESAKQAADSTTQLESKTKQSTTIFQRAGDALQAFGNKAKQAIGDATKQIGGLQGVGQRVGNVLNGLGATAGKALGAVGDNLKQIAGSIPGIGGIATALGPVGIAAGAIGAGLFKVVTNLDAGKTAVEGFGIAAGVAFDRITGSLATAVSSTATLGERFNALASLFNTQKFVVDASFGQAVANALDEQEDKQLGVNEAVAKNETQLAKNVAQLRNTNLTAEERLKIADDITRIEQENLKLKQDQLRADLNILKAQAALQQTSKGEVDDTLKKQISDLNVALDNAETESVRLTEKVAVRREGIVAQEEANKKAIRDKAEADRQKAAEKAAAAREKREQEEAKRAEQRVQAQAKLDDILNTLADEQLARTQTEAEKEVTATEQKYEDLEKVAREGINKLREVSPPGAEAAIAQQEANILVQIAKAKEEELTAIRKKAADDLAKEREEGREKLRKQLLDDTEAQREAILERFDEDVALAEKSIEDQAERDEVIRKLREKAEKDLTGVISSAEQERLELERAAAEERKRREQERIDIIKNASADALGILIQTAAEGEALSQESSKALLLLMLDTLEKIMLAQAFQAQAMVTGAPTPDNIATGGISGTIKGIAMFALIKGLFSAVKGILTANYTGDPFVGGDGSRPMWSGRDGFLRRLDYGERVVTGKTNAKYFDEMQAMEDGKWDSYLDNNYILPAIEALRYNDDERAVKFVQSDMGQRMAASITLPRMFDKNIVQTQMQVSKQQRRTNELLEAMVQNTRPRAINKRYY